MKKYKTGGVANPNAKVTVSKGAGSEGVGKTKSPKINKPDKPSTKGAGTTKNQKAVVSPGSKKK